MKTDGGAPEAVFVYGTLRRGQPNHFLLADAYLLSDCAAAPGFRLYHLGAYPAAQPTGRETDTVRGEIYQVRDRDTLTRIDALEGFPDLYDRTETRVQDESGTVHVARIYFMRELPPHARAIAGGDWTRTSPAPPPDDR